MYIRLIDLKIVPLLRLLSKSPREEFYKASIGIIASLHVPAKIHTMNDFIKIDMCLRFILRFNSLITKVLSVLSPKRAIEADRKEGKKPL